jgi:predicted lipoprotein with Yx(FWY)xxD motif
MKFRRASRIFAVIVLAAFAGSAVASSDILISKTGMTIYTFDKDSAGKSNCNGACLALWPAVPVADAPTADRDFGSIQRDDGTQQLTYRNQPVYYFIKDKKPGDVNGDNVKGIWHVIPKNAPRASREPNGYYGGSAGYDNSYSSY